MRVGLNATCFDDRPSGANQRFRGIYGALVRQRPDIEFIVYEPVGHAIAEWFEGAPNVTARRTPVPASGRLARLRAGLPYWRRQLAADRLDLFEVFNLPLVGAPDCPTLLTIHDLRPVLRDVPLLSRLVAGPIVRHALSRADRVIAVSDAIAADIRATVPSASVSTVYNGVDPRPFATVAEGAVAGMRARYGLPEDYLLAVGHLEPRKNLALLIDAVAALRDRGLARPLAIVGNDGGSEDALRAQVAAMNLQDRVTFIAGADDDAVRALYAGCRLLVFPSRYEGFGIPVIEAMAAGRPMALADTAVFRELTQGQGAYFPVDDPARAADAIERVWSDPAERARQVAFGQARLEDFLFEQLATEVAAIYEALASQSLRQVSQ